MGDIPTRLLLEHVSQRFRGFVVLNDAPTNIKNRSGKVQIGVYSDPELSVHLMDEFVERYQNGLREEILERFCD